jgi:hypothetical protein
VVNGFEAYRDMPGVQMGPKTYKWFREHAHYDDEHPKIAMEIVRKYATTERMQTKVMLAAKRSVQLLQNALETGYKAYSVTEETVVPHSDLRASNQGADRRQAQLLMTFPDRRFSDRRGRQLRAVA